MEGFSIVEYGENPAKLGGKCECRTVKSGYYSSRERDRARDRPGRVGFGGKRLKSNLRLSRLVVEHSDMLKPRGEGGAKAVGINLWCVGGDCGGVTGLGGSQGEVPVYDRNRLSTEYGVVMFQRF